MSKSKIVFFVLVGILGLLVGGLYLFGFPSTSSKLINFSPIKKSSLPIASPSGSSPVTTDSYIVIDAGGGGAGGGAPYNVQGGGGNGGHGYKMMITTSPVTLPNLK